MAIIAYSLVLASLLIWPQICVHSARDALAIWSLHVVPSLFPYMIFSKLLCEQIKHTSCPPALICAVLGIFGGSPSGAAMISTYHTRLSGKAALSLVAFTGTISPMFFLGTVNSWTNKPHLGTLLLITQFIGAAMTAVFLFFLFPSSSAGKECKELQQHNEKSPLSQSIDAVLQIGGCIICFSVIASLLGQLPFPKALYPLLHAALEISGGIHAILHFPFPERMQGILLAYFSGFGGLCILLQNLLFLRPIGVSLHKLLFVSLTRGLFSAAVMTMLLSI